jgi:hypothetical protein
VAAVELTMIMILDYVSGYLWTGTVRCLPPGDGPLLKTDNLSSLARQWNLGEIDRNLGRADADTEAIYNTTDDEHGDILRSADDDTSNDPDDGSDLDGDLACKVRT